MREQKVTDDSSARQQYSLIGLLAARDLRDEPLLSICLISAVAAVLAPIMILAGLKLGYIEVLRSKLVNDPAFRLILPKQSALRSNELFSDLSKRNDIAFIQPTVNHSGTQIRLQGPGSDRKEIFEMVPTGTGDPLVLENGGAIPRPGEITLSNPGAAALKAKPGDEVTLVIARSGKRKREFVKLPLKVRSVLDISADRKKTVYAPQQLAYDVERFKSGIPVSKRKWSGVASPPRQSFDGVFALTSDPMIEVDIHEIRISSGFSAVKKLTLDQFVETGGEPLSHPQQILYFSNGNRPVRAKQIESLASRLAGRGFWLLPHVALLNVIAPGAANPSATSEKSKPATIPVRALLPRHLRVSYSDGLARGWVPWRAKRPYGAVDRALVPRTLAQAYGWKLGDRVFINAHPERASDATRDLSIKLVIDGLTEETAILIHPALAGMLHATRQTNTSYDPNLNTLISTDPGLRGFRAYATSIDVVPTLARDLEKQGIPVRAKVDTIEQVQRADRALTRITFIIGMVALIGGSAVLIASLYAAVERKKSELSLMRLVGFSRASVFSMPIYQALMLATLGFLLAWGLFVVFAYVINTHFAPDLVVEGEICRLQPIHIIFFAAVTILIAAISSLFAAVYTTRIDPAEALRIE